MLSEALTESERAARRARVRRVARPWRIAFVVYALALTTGTHWPRLTLGPEIPATDKLIHMVAFAGLTILLWRTKWIARRWVVGAIVLAWSCADEVSQGIPALNRTVSWYDVMANAMGVITATMWLWALGPAGAEGGAFRARAKLNGFIVDEMFARPGAWLSMLGGFVAGSTPLLMMWNAMPVERMRVAIVIALTVMTVVTLLMWMRLWRQRREEVWAAMPCMECGTSVGGMNYLGGEGGACAACGAQMNPDVWITPGSGSGSGKGKGASERASAAASAGLMIRPAVLGVTALVLGFGVIFLLPVLYEMMIAGGGSGRQWMPRLAHWVGTLPPGLTTTIDLSAYMVLFAAMVRVYRTAMAKFADRAVRCRRCGHDLRGTPTQQGTGRGVCGECGTMFLRAG